jgi:hypothetical protein
MSCSSCDSRSHNRSSSLPSSFLLLYHTERKLVLDLAVQREAFRRDFAYAFQQVHSFIIGSGTNAEEYDQYFDQMLLDDFGGLWLYLSAIGQA